MKLISIVTLVLALSSTSFRSAEAGEAEPGGPPLAHMVFFELKDATGEAKEKLAAACAKYLSGHEGTIYFSVGTIADEMNREVNDRKFHVALHVVFKNKAAHDNYQKHPRHLQFIEECKEGWKSVRVFDSYLSESRERDDPPRRIPLPDPAAGFAGMIRGEVVAKRGDQVVVLVKEVPEEWSHSGAKDSKALVGKPVLVESYSEEGEYRNTILRFLRSLDVGEVVTLDVAHKRGEALMLLELTEDQRETLREEG